jgi:hypothetical protein
MPKETLQAIEWALTQTYQIGDGTAYPITKDTPHYVVDKVREYFNTNFISYASFSFTDLLNIAPILLK